MPNINASVKKCVSTIKEMAPDFKPKIGVILGSGLGTIAQQINNPTIIDYKNLDGFYLSALDGHSKRMHLGSLRGVPVVCLEGRTHLYEGQNAVDSLKIMIRTLKMLGCEILLTTNAVGSLRLEHGPGHLMIIEDHINFTFHNPLIGANDPEFGDRFVSMDNAYDIDLRNKLLALAEKLAIPHFAGVYVATLGPTFESHAEIRASKMMGGDAVGMSTVPETILARHCGLKVASICAITNLGAGLSSETLSHEGTLRGAKLAAEHIIKLFLAFIEELNGSSPTVIARNERSE